MGYSYRQRLNSQANRFNSVNQEPIFYRRGGTVLEIMACKILEHERVMLPGMILTRIENQDWTLDIADLSPLGSGEDSYPMVNDQITDENGDIFIIICDSEVPNASPYNFITSSRTRVRIHSHRIELG